MLNILERGGGERKVAGNPAQGGFDPGGVGPPDEQNQLLQDQTQCTIPTPDCNTFLLKQGELR